MPKTPHKNIIYTVPLIALAIVVLQIIMVKTNGLSRWKGGGFGMYSEIHYSHNEVWIKNKAIAIDSLVKKSRALKASIKTLQIMPSKKNLYRVAKFIAKQTQNDTIVLQVWKPKIDINNRTYHRTLTNEIEYIN